VKKRMRSIAAARRAARAPDPRPGGWPLVEPFEIGDLTLQNRVVQAPLAGIANAAFRRQSRRHGAGLVVSEMISSRALVRGHERTRAMIELGSDEHPAAIQLLGFEPDVMAEAAVMAAEAGAVAVDINMGCPVKKVCKTGAGAALLDDPEAGTALVSAMVRAVDIPVTVKMRRGTTPDNSRPTEVAKALVDAGAAAVFLHPRAAKDEYSGTADHTVTAAVVAAVDVPVIASGDVVDAASAVRVIDETGCAAVALARGCLGNPWAFADVVAGRAPSPRSRSEVVAELTAFGDDIAALLSERTASVYLRKFYPWYLADHDVDGQTLEALVTAETRHEAAAILHQVVAQPLAA
jgi:tRNA-dihydrouridine synthase B